MDPQYASYRRGIVLRVGSSLLIEAAASGALLGGIIHAHNIVGVSLSVAFIVVMCSLFFPVMRSVLLRGNPGLIQVASVIDRLMVVIGYTGIIYSLGGIEASYLVPIYIIFMIYYVVATDRKMPYITATISFLCYSAAVFLEYLGLIPHLNVVPGYHAPLDFQLAALGVSALFLYVSAFTTSYASHIIERSRVELRARNIELQNATDRALQSDRLKTELLSNMSHELRTPLHHVIGFTELVLDEAGGSLAPPQQEALNDALGSARHLLTVLSDIVDLSRLESGNMTPAQEIVEIHPLLGRAVNDVQEKAREAGVDVSLESSSVPCRARADARMLRRTVDHLLSNAVKFTPPGGYVAVAARPVQGARLLVSVSDTGIGLDAEHLETIFLPFNTIQAAQRARDRGIGLGLPLARRYVELLGGRLWAESEGPGRGSTFQFTLPIVP